MILAHPAPYACNPSTSRGRLYPEPESATRDCFQRDHDRIIHSTAFRRLQYKTQVFVNHQGDLFRTRLTHTLEVSQIARSVCRSLNLNEDLAEALALAHDLGHPPFGHAGEYALSDKMAPFGGFDHNAQSLKIITSLEHGYAEFDGLNLTWETLEGVTKHNGPLVDSADEYSSLPRVIREYVKVHDLEVDTYAGAEAQVASLADDIAYNNHDIDDGLRAGLFTIKDLEEVPLVGPSIMAVRRKYPDIGGSRLAHEVVRRMIGEMVKDLFDETARRLAEAGPKSADDIRGLDRPIAGFSEQMQVREKALKDFLSNNMYRHEKLNNMTAMARDVIMELFDLFMEQPEKMPADWFRMTDGHDRKAVADTIADYIAGMTDRFALGEHKRLCRVRGDGQ